MKKKLTFLKTLLCSFGLFSFVEGNAQQFEWAGAFGGSLATTYSPNSNAYVRASIADETENLYLCGQFQDTTDMDPSSNTFTFSPYPGQNSKNAFVSKLGKEGNLVWVTKIGNMNGENQFSEPIAHDIAIDYNGDIFVTGTFTDTIRVNTTNGITTLIDSTPPVGALSSFIAKLDNSNGNIIWIKAINYINANAISIDRNNNIILSGYYNGNPDFDPAINTAYYLPLPAPSSFQNGFLCKLNNNGGFIWARGIHTDVQSSSISIGLSTDMNNNILTGGNFRGATNFNVGGSTPFLLTSTLPTGSAFIGKYDSLGNPVWINELNGGGIVYSIATDTAKNIYAVGNFSDFLYFDTFNLISNGDQDIFTVKLDSVGFYLWANHIGGSGEERVYSSSSLDVDKYGNSYITGSFRNTIDLDPGLGTLNYTSVGLRDIFISKYATNGTVVWGSSFGAVGNDDPYTISVDENNNIYTGGRFRNTIDFDPSPITYNVTSLHSVHTSLFALKLSCGDTSLVHTTEIACGSYTLGNQTYTQSGTYTQQFPTIGGCDSTVVLQLTIADTSVSVSNNILSSNQSNATYQWINCANNAPVAGATNQSFSPSADGSYAVVITINGCSDTSGCYNISGTGIYELGAGNVVSAYPNPTTEIVHIQTTNALKNATLRAVNLIGQTVITKENLNGNLQKIALGSLAPGIYTVELSEEGKTVRMKLVKE